MINYNECEVRDTEYFKAFIFINSSGEKCLARLLINQIDNESLDLNKIDELKDIVVVGFRNVELATDVVSDDFDTLVLPRWVERINRGSFQGSESAACYMARQLPTHSLLCFSGQ